MNLSFQGKGYREQKNVEIKTIEYMASPYLQDSPMLMMNAILVLHFMNDDSVIEKFAPTIVFYLRLFSACPVTAKVLAARDA